MKSVNTMPYSHFSMLMVLHKPVCAADVTNIISYWFTKTTKVTVKRKTKTKNNIKNKEIPTAQISYLQNWRKSDCRNVYTSRLLIRIIDADVASKPNKCMIWFLIHNKHQCFHRISFVVPVSRKGSCHLFWFQRVWALVEVSVIHPL